MGIHMKTTVEISDALLERAKERAAARETTLRALIEEGLRSVLAEDAGEAGFCMRKGSVGGNGLRPEIRDGSWNRIVEVSYEGRGG